MFRLTAPCRSWKNAYSPSEFVPTCKQSRRVPLDQRHSAKPEIDYPSLMDSLGRLSRLHADGIDVVERINQSIVAEQAEVVPARPNL